MSFAKQQRLAACVATVLLAMGARGVAEEPAQAPAPYGALPTEQHLRWHDYQFYAFVHFNMNTFTGVEWGDGKETPERFNPTAFDANQWCKLFKECGLTGVIITAKHHDGFCLWPSKYTEHDVENSPWRDGKGDVLKELAEACQRRDLWLGVYISPWDRNNPLYGKQDAAYNEYFNGQLTELLTGYGPIAEVWWDGANGDRNNPEKHQEYDWRTFNQTVRKHQPDAVIFAPPYANVDIGVRWVGNERGYAGATQWSTHPTSGGEVTAQLNQGVKNANKWFPAETDVSIRPGWYWHPDSDKRVKSVEKLLDIYYHSVGHNTNLLLNFPVDNRGLVHENDAAALRGMAEVLKKSFANDLAAGAMVEATNTRAGDARFAAAYVTDENEATYWATDDNVTSAALTVKLDNSPRFDTVVLKEHIALGQRVEGWKLEAQTGDTWLEVATGTTIGHKRIVRFDARPASALRLTITKALACPTIASVKIYDTSTANEGKATGSTTAKRTSNRSGG